MWKNRASKYAYLYHQNKKELLSFNNKSINSIWEIQGKVIIGAPIIQGWHGYALWFRHASLSENHASSADKWPHSQWWSAFKMPPRLASTLWHCHLKDVLCMLGGKYTHYGNRTNAIILLCRVSMLDHIRCHDDYKKVWV